MAMVMGMAMKIEAETAIAVAKKVRNIQPRKKR